MCDKRKVHIEVTFQNYFKVSFSVSVARMEQKELESLKENSKLHERINELLRSHAELNDSIKHSTPIPTSSLANPRDSGNCKSLLFHLIFMIA